MREYGIGEFFRIFREKLGRFIPANLIMFFISLPQTVWLYATINTYLSALGMSVDSMPGLGLIALPAAVVPRSVFGVLLIASLLLRGPAEMVLTYIYRKAVASEYLPLGELPLVLRRSLKQGLFFGALDVIVVLVVLHNVMGFDGVDGMILAVLQYVSAALLCAYLAIRPYWYLFAVTLDESVLQILRRGLVCAALRSNRTISAALAALLVWAVTLFTVPLTTIVLLPTVSYSLSGYAVVYILYPVLYRDVLGKH